jgi:hypothetical protein
LDLAWKRNPAAVITRCWVTWRLERGVDGCFINAVRAQHPPQAPVGGQHELQQTCVDKRVADVPEGRSVVQPHHHRVALADAVLEASLVEGRHATGDTLRRRPRAAGCRMLSGVLGPSASFVFRQADLAEDPRRCVASTEDGEQDMTGSDTRVAARRGLIIGALDGRHRLGTERQRVRGLAPLASSTKSGHDVAQALGSQPEDRLIDACDRHQQVVGADLIVTEPRKPAGVAHRVAPGGPY